MWIVSLILALVFALGSGVVLAQTKSDKWQYRLTPYPYIWLPVIDGTVNYDLSPGGGGPAIRIGPTDWLDLLNFGGLVSASAKKGRFTIFADFVYLGVRSKNNGRVVSVEDTVTAPGTRISIPVSADLNLDTRTDLDGLFWMAAGGYTLKETDTTILDVFAGLRFFSIDIDSAWILSSAITTPGDVVVLPAQGSIRGDTALQDGIVGVRGHFGIGEGKWSIPFYFDVGSGSSKLTWHAMAGLSYSVRWGDVFIVYRHLEYDQDSDGLLQNFSFSGPSLGAGFNF